MQSMISGRAKWVTLGLVWLSLFVAYLDRVNISIAGPTMMNALHLSPATFGWLLSAFSIGYAVMQIPAGALADRFGSRNILVIALVWWSLFTGLTGLATSVAAFARDAGIVRCRRGARKRRAV